MNECREQCLTDYRLYSLVYTQSRTLRSFTTKLCLGYEGAVHRSGVYKDETNSSFDAPGIPLVLRLGWKTIEELIAHESELMVFKSIHGLAPQYMGDLFTKISQLSPHNLRNTATGLRLPQKRYSNGLKCFSYRGAKTWNSLPTKCKQAKTTRDFKSCL